MSSRMIQSKHLFINSYLKWSKTVLSECFLLRYWETRIVSSSNSFSTKTIREVDRMWNWNIGEEEWKLHPEFDLPEHVLDSTVTKSSDFLQRLHNQWEVEQAAVNLTATGPKVDSDICHLIFLIVNHRYSFRNHGTLHSCFVEKVMYWSLKSLSPGNPWTSSNYYIRKDTWRCIDYHKYSVTICVKEPGSTVSPSTNIFTK